MKHNIGELYQMQSLPLNAKITMTITRIRGWLDAWDDNCYISFSGGKDSTVLVDIIYNRMGRTDIPLVFVDTGLEYPEIREFVKSYGDKVTWLRPKMNFRQVIEKYGYPFISKEIAHKISDMNSAHAKGNESYVDKQFDGTYISKNGKVNKRSIQRYKFLKECPYKISHKCCNIMKKNPVKEYSKKHNLKPITAQMANESYLRTMAWILNGCNAFDAKDPISNPMSFWTEQDILQYIKLNNLPICSVYGDIIEKDCKLITTKCKRTGCMFCGFGCQIKGDERFLRMKETHPQQYEWIMKPWDEGGLGYKEVIDWMNEQGNLNIRY